jgi:hypothetical protein
MKEGPRDKEAQIMMPPKNENILIMFPGFIRNKCPFYHFRELPPPVCLLDG